MMTWLNVWGHLSSFKQTIGVFIAAVIVQRTDTDYGCWVTSSSETDTNTTNVHNRVGLTSTRPYSTMALGLTVLHMFMP